MWHAPRWFDPSLPNPLTPPTRAFAPPLTPPRRHSPPRVQPLHVGTAHLLNQHATALVLPKLVLWWGLGRREVSRVVVLGWGLLHISAGTIRYTCWVAWGGGGGPGSRNGRDALTVAELKTTTVLATAGGSRGVGRGPCQVRRPARCWVTQAPHPLPLHTYASAPGMKVLLHLRLRDPCDPSSGSK